jgi:exopolysaccharide production protein ExoY
MAAPSISLPRALSIVPSRTSYPERLAAGIGLILVSPVLVAVLGTAWILSLRTPLVAHLRVGQFGDPLWVYKVRTMWGGAESHRQRKGWVEYLSDPVVPAAKTGRDPRVTSRFAAFCRRHSLDELPQMFQVATGRMRLAGPRPMTQIELDLHYGGVQTELLAVPPGLTGLWQVMGRNRLSYSQRRRLDLFLVRHANWKLRALILVRTVKEILTPRHAW